MIEHTNRLSTPPDLVVVTSIVSILTQLTGRLVQGTVHCMNLSHVQLPPETRQRIVLIDVDGVLADFATAFVDILNELTGSQKTLTDITEYSLTCLAPAEEVGEVFDFMEKHDTYYDLTPYPGAVKFVRQCRDQDWRVVAVTAVEPRFCVARRYWLERYLGFRKQDIIFAHDKSLISGDVMIEDCVDNLLAWPGRVKFLIDQPWNKGTFPGVTRAKFAIDR